MTIEVNAGGYSHGRKGDDPATVNFTVKELLADQTVILARIEGKLDGKAERSELERLAAKVDGHEIILQRADAERAGAKASQAKVIAYVGTGVSAAIGGVGLALKLFVR